MLNKEHVNPDIKWYTSISKEKGFTPRCPFGTVEQCPRYFCSLSNLAKSNLITSIEKNYDVQLLTYWEKSKFWPSIIEQDTGISGADGKKTGFHNFCPEVAYDIFGIFASTFLKYTDLKDKEIYLSQIENELKDINDWRLKWHNIKPMHYSECNLYSLLINNSTELEPFKKVDKIDSIAALEKIELLCNKFHTFVKKLNSRNDIGTIDTQNEYDVQQLLYALLSLFFDDIRKEEFTPSHAGSFSRIDILLKNEQIGIEIKKTRKKLIDKKIGEELIDDIEKYQMHKDCKKLICFIYDPDEILSNPNGIINDLNKKHQEFVKIIINPMRTK